MSAAAARGEGRTGEDRSRGCWLCQSQYLVLRIVYFTCKKGHSLFPFSSLWKEFSSPLLLIPRLHQARVNSPKPNASSKAILPRRRGSSESGLVAARAKNPFSGLVCLLLNTELDHWRRSTESYSNRRTRGRRSPHFRSQVPAPGHPTPSQTKGCIQQAASS